ncbi:MAG: MAPEG family protein [Pseudomonadota bacterium]
MQREVTALAFAALLQVGQFCLYSRLAIRQVGAKVALGPRDQIPALTGYAGRAQRAMQNNFEALILFIVAVVVVTLTDGASSWLTATCAWTYVAARVLYVPAYLFAWVPGRSVVWAVGLIATITMLGSALIS